MDKITWKWLNQMPSNLAHICIGICTKHNNVFNRWLSLMTSSRRHFVKILRKSTHDHIFITESYFSFIFIMIRVQYPSGQFQVKERARARTSARQCARKILKCSKSSQNHFAYVLGHSKHFIKNRAHVHARAFSRVKQLHNIESPFFFSFIIFHIFLQTNWYHVCLFMTINNGMIDRLT